MRRTLLLIFAGLIAVATVFLAFSNSAQFVAGGALVNLGYRLQDPIAGVDLDHHEASPMQIWEAFLSHNRMAADVRSRWPRSNHHPEIALVACMDARLDTNEIAGDTRRYYYVLRLAGSALAPKDEEMLQLAVANGVKVVVFTTHTDCAAERVAANPEQRQKFPQLAKAVDERQMRFDEFRSTPMIRERMQKNELMVKWMDLDTMNERVMPHVQALENPATVLARRVPKPNRPLPDFR
jgi:carbonic anhydrase